ncbi:3-hydroxyacyl-CoA dehydrogenase/enoyl-CoA hydratase/3-hydroxybutyryl-CoA epimerase [Arthrobacter stackebrandtii]|uniref:3-hydroxyacyl-CoA dehydrogenase/enoyl-CoA hydratase/3-hydroxybutyryl-CoA epimerase n=1 Tax=Arthrobacter stackebrandtii TaxID=272161 RepID=A0ABS4YYY0_9MICC|nr:3-hydroxyacyl-CoA dehydrogenase NAD-binding domain-containing protein [Arthrobacter stackebrandtii]MBP2413652.1 3-hydroxyacyl-CoA dehydrogenase/enoyl-CoA hydratase/3-hydroxybutyryl-CoA epimerase [Arthrobacter stackebrandtii]PYG99957.1 3-hydroxyacyl-CoA dehydrogenase [Arthrobacter stackebrandtii]
MSEENVNHTSTIRWDRDEDGIVILTMDDPKQSANTMNGDYIDSMQAVVERLAAEKESISGVVLTSAKKTFFAGGDLKDLISATPADAQRIFDLGQKIKAQLRTLETLGKPVVAAINGAALGGGLEIALAAHHRIAADTRGSVIGLPEVTLGLLPGGGGIVRTVRLMGIADATMKVLLQGQKYKPRKALEVGLIHEVVDTVEELLPAARAWIKSNREAVQPWDVPKYRIPGGTPTTPALAANLPAFPANLRKQLKGANYPAPRAILAAAVESTQVDFDTALEIESRYFVELVTGQVSTNMIKAFFFDMGHISAGGSRPAGFEKYTAKKVAVLGAGMMGAGIAYVCARGGMDVVLKDVSLEAAERGKNYSKTLTDKAVARGQSTQEAADALLAQITPTADAADVAGADLVIEAVFENVEVKQKAFAEIQDLLGENAVLGSNTSTLPITALAEGVREQENFIGLHFFSPVDKMPLLEIIAGANTSDETLAKAFDIAQQIKKTPIVVNDSRGFFTSRVIGTFMNEAIAMLGEGIAASSIEQAGLQAGYPAAPLQLADELNLTLMSKIQKETKAGLEADGGVQKYQHHASYAIVDRMIEEFGRKGKLAGAGFYNYADGHRTGLWEGLKQNYGGTAEIPFEDMLERMLFAESLETVKCLDEGVLRSVEDANIGSILGIGFPAWTGGVLQYINGYDGGLAGFVARSRELAARYGEHFIPPASLVAKAEKGGKY